MHVDRGGHAGREGRFQIFSAEVAPRGIDRKRTDVGQMPALSMRSPLAPTSNSQTWPKACTTTPFGGFARSGAWTSVKV